MTHEPTILDVMRSVQDVLDTLNVFATHVDGEFREVKTDLHSLNARVTTIESTMVTKNYLDDKIADLRGDLVLLARKGNTKLSTLVEEL